MQALFNKKKELKTYSSLGKGGYCTSQWLIRARNKLTLHLFGLYAAQAILNKRSLFVYFWLDRVVVQKPSPTLINTLRMTNAELKFVLPLTLLLPSHIEIIPFVHRSKTNL